MQNSSFNMFRHNKSKVEVGSTYQGYMVPPHPRNDNPSRQSRRRGSSIASSTKLNANKYSISNVNHTIIDHNYCYNVYKYTIYDNYASINGHDQSNRKIDDYEGFNGSYIYDNDKYSMYVNGKYTGNNKNDSSRDREGKCDGGGDGEEGEDDFTFSSVAESMEFFTSEGGGACMHGRPSMSPADELFQDGKIRPLIQPIIDGYNQSIKPITSAHDQPTSPYDQPTSAPERPMNLFEPSLDQHASFDQFAAQYYSAATVDHCVIKQELPAEKPDFLHLAAPDHGLNSDSNPKLLHQGAPDHGLSGGSNQKSLHHGELLHGLTSEINQKTLHHGEILHGLRSEINQKSLQNDHGLSADHGLNTQMCDDQLELKEPNHGRGWPLQVVSLSAPTSPVKEVLANEHNDRDHARSHHFYSVVSTSQVSSYKKSRKLSRVFHLEDNDQILEVQGFVEDGTEGGGFLIYKRKTLQDLLTQEENPMSKPHHESIKESYIMKQLGLESPDRDAKSFYDAKRRPSLAPKLVNIPHPWTVREKLGANPSTNGKCSKAPSPHELHYGSQKAQAHRFSKKTFLPYRPTLFGCLGYPPH